MQGISLPVAAFSFVVDPICAAVLVGPPALVSLLHEGVELQLLLLCHQLLLAHLCLDQLRVANIIRVVRALLLSLSECILRHSHEITKSTCD